MSWRALASGVLVISVLFWLAWMAGRFTGRAEATTACAHANTKVFQDLIEQSATHLQETNAASVQLFQQLRLRHEADRATTEELRHALAETADSRADCRFPDSVMQQLESTRARAAEATTSGLGAAVPAAGGHE